MRAGKHRHRITFQQKKTTKNTRGEKVISWVDYVNVWASIKPIRGKEIWHANQIKATTSHEIEIRYLHGQTFTSDMRIIYGSRIFQIDGFVNIEERNIKYIFLCTEVL